MITDNKTMSSSPEPEKSPSKPDNSQSPATADNLLQEDNITSDSPSAELTASVESLLDSLTHKFSSVSAEIFSKMDEMSTRLDALEELMQGEEPKK